MGAFPAACNDATVPLFEGVPTNLLVGYLPNYSLYLHVNTTSQIGLCLGVKDVPPTVGSLVWALPCDTGSTSIMWVAGQKGGVRWGRAVGNPPSPPALCINATAVRVSLGSDTV